MDKMGLVKGSLFNLQSCNPFLKPDTLLFASFVPTILRLRRKHDTPCQRATDGGEGGEGSACVVNFVRNANRWGRTFLLRWNCICPASCWGLLQHPTFYHPSHWSSEREGFHVKKCKMERPKESCAQCQGYRPLEAAPIAGLPERLWSENSFSVWRAENRFHPW